MCKHLAILLALLSAFALAGCTGAGETTTQQAAIDAAWRDLDPVTASHNRANFEPVEARQITGDQSTERFKDSKTNSYCWGTKIATNDPISPTGKYWYIVLRRRPMTPLPVTRVSPTQPPAVPDANIYEAYFLVDTATGRVVARNIPCIVF